MRFTRRSLLSLLPGLTIAAKSGVAHASADPIVGPIEFVGGRVAMPVTINDGKTFMFAIDTGGAMSLISETVAHDIGLSRAGYADIGVAGQNGPRPLYETDSVTFAGIVRQKHARFAGIPGDVLGDGIAGSLDCGLLTTLLCELDYEALEWKVWLQTRPDLSGYTRLDGGITNPPGGFSPFIVASARVNNSDRRFLLDTGSESFIRLNHDVAHDLGLWSDDRPFAPFRGGARITRLDRLDFGGSGLQLPLALLLKDNRESDVADGLLGLPTLQRFNLVYDPAKDGLWVRRNNRPAPAEHYPLSGLWVEPSGGTMRVTVVGTGSPAQKAGMQVGDLVLDETAPALFQRLGGIQGSVVTLETEREGHRSTASFTLTPYL